MSEDCLTHHSKHCEPPWLAVHKGLALAMLEAHGLTEEEKTDLGALMAGYCNVLEGAGLCHYGYTEREAVAFAVRQAELWQGKVRGGVMDGMNRMDGGHGDE